MRCGDYTVGLHSVCVCVYMLCTDGSLYNLKSKELQTTDVDLRGGDSQNG